MNPPSHMSEQITEIESPLLEEAVNLAAILAADWRRGHCYPAEQVLAAHPEVSADPQAALRVVYEEICQRLELGQHISLSELSERFPQWCDQLAVLLDCINLLGLTPDGPRFPAIGETLGAFRLLAELGRGARGRVYLAEQTFLAGRFMILKLVPLVDQEHLNLARLQHTHIVPLYSIRDFPERHLRKLCMPCLGGASLQQVLRTLRSIAPEKRMGNDLLQAIQSSVADPHLFWPAQGPNRRFLEKATFVQTVCWMGVCLADALHYAHEQGLVHLDLKPSNVLLTADCQPMLLDFHLARGPLRPGDTPDFLGGTPGYMAPEQEAALRACHAKQPLPAAVDARADVYALGLLLREALYGQHASEDSPSIQHLSTGLRDVLARCLKVDPEARYPSAGQVAEDLRRHLMDRSLVGVRNRSLAERWGKWRRRQPHALALLLMTAVCLAAAIGGTLSVKEVAQRPDSEIASAQAQQLAGPSVDPDKELRPQDFSSWFDRGTAAYRNGRHDEAVTAFSVCVALAPDNAACYYNRGLAFSARGDAAAALRDYNRALQIDPRLAAAALNRGVLHLQERRFDAADADFRLARELGANPAAVYYNWALLYEARAEPAAAMERLERALEFDPHYRPAHDLRARLRKQLLSSPDSR
jgi:serine/threonine protein kinase